MGRFYSASGDNPQFIDGMYTPPWELINKKLEENQQGYDNTLASTNLFNDIDIQHIDDPILKEQAQKIKDYYTQKSQSITEAIQKDPMAWKKAMPEIQSLSKDLMKNMKSGDIADMQNQYSSLSKFVAENSELKKKSPADYNRALGYYLKQWQSDPLRKKSFDWENVAAPIDQDKLIKDIQAIKASVKETSNGMYLVGDKEVSKDQIDQAARSYVYGRPENAAYLAQQVKFGNPDYYNEDYSKLHPGSNGLYETLYKNKNGKVLSPEEVYQKQIKYQQDMIAYVKKREKGDKTALPPVKDYEEQKGAIGRILDEAVAMGYHSEHTVKVDSAKVAIQTAQMHINAQKAIANANLNMKKYQVDLDHADKQASNLNKSIENINKAIEMIPGKSPQKDQLMKDRDALMASSIQVAYKASSTETPQETSETKTQGTKDAPASPTIAKTKEEQYSDALTTLSREVPKTLSELNQSALQNPGSRNEKLYSQVMWRAKQDVDKNLKSYTVKKTGGVPLGDIVHEFFDFYSKNVKSDTDIKESLDSFVKSKLKTGLPLTVQGKNKKVTEDMFTRSYGQEEANEANNSLQFLKKSILRVVSPALDKQENYLKSKSNDVQHHILFPISEIGSKNLMSNVIENRGAFSFVPVDDEGKIDLKKTSNSKDIDSDLNEGNFKADKAFLDPVGNSHSDAFYISNGKGKKYLVYPNTNGDNRNSDQSQVIRQQILNQPDFVNAKDKGFQFKNNVSNQTFKNVDNQLKVDIPISYKAPDGSIKMLRTAKYTIPYQGKNVGIRIVSEEEGGKQTFKALVDGSDHEIFSGAASLTAAMDLVNQAYK